MSVSNGSDKEDLKVRLESNVDSTGNNLSSKKITDTELEHEHTSARSQGVLVVQVSVS